MIDRVKISFITLTGAPVFGEGTFTRSNGALIPRIYERLTKQSRRRVEHLDDNHPNIRNEEIYRAGIYDAYKALQEELNAR